MTSGFVSFLKKFGQDAVKVIEAASGEPKVILQQVEKDSTDLKTLVSLVKTSEAMYQLFAGPNAPQGGSGKLAAITPDVTAIVGDVEVLAGTKISSIVKDQAGFNAGVQNLISAMVQILNACGD